jgi:membrane protease subunit (stomatin/prohibitin family)
LRIKVNVLDPQSINNAIKELKAYSNSIDSKVSDILGRLAELGKEVVDYSFSSLDEDCEVSCIVNGNSSMIIAEGQNVMFLEFGTGVYTEDNTEEMDTEGLPPIFAGSYSQTEGMGHFRPDHQYWYYNRVKYQGTLPSHGFYFASKEIKEQAVEIAKRVFKK